MLEPATEAVLAEVARAGPEEVDEAVARAKEALPAWRGLAPGERARLLHGLAETLLAHLEELALLEARNAGKAISDARGEMTMVVDTFRYYAGAPERLLGDTIPVAGGQAFTVREPLGVVGLITPWNFPLTIASWKLAPALAAGNTVVLKPAELTPLTALRFADLAAEAGLPEGVVNVVVGPGRTCGQRLVEHPDVAKIAFTGSTEVGRSIAAGAAASIKRVTLELGGNAAVIVNHDADVAYAAERIAWGGFTNAGQTCISVQRVFVHEDVYDAFVADLVRRVEELKVGDPLDEDTDVGPVIDAANADRIEEWLDEAKAAGATVLTGGEREGGVWRPTVLANLREDLRVSCEEVFAPVVGVTGFSDVEQAIDAAGRSEFGLQGGLFTHDMRVVDAAFDRIEVGGLMINDVSTFRIDHMPYGGVKSSGFGREGLRYAIEEMTELKLLTFNNRSGV